MDLAVLNNVQNDTELNAHTDARIKIAEYYGLTEFTKAFEAINVLHEFSGYLSHGLVKERNDITDLMIARIKVLFPKEDIEEIIAVI